MSGYVFKLPDIGEGIAEAEIVHWHVAVGVEISEDAPLVDMMTDKATVEMESPVSGKVVEIAGADQPGYNGQFRVIAATATSFTYAVTGTPVSPATSATSSGSASFLRRPNWA